MSAVIQFPRRSRAGSVNDLRLRRLDEGSLVLPPVRLRHLPAGGVVGRFMGVLALRFDSSTGPLAVFVHDLDADDQAAVLAHQRRIACDQLGQYDSPVGVA